ncbi:hypothetical protein EU520_00540 [Candidatus Thorarchaeota archaeon]|nr:MAG: hypothetical protein EU520_00540 [Candidatus Thorarchaeota archaeon]
MSNVTRTEKSTSNSPERTYLFTGRVFASSGFKSIGLTIYGERVSHQGVHGGSPPFHGFENMSNAQELLQK